MILSRIQIENYKQYQGEHDIDVPAQATIGVIGENGAGKTTLFEAIEWCFYSPRSISPSEVRPRHFSGHTTVRVHLESADGERQFIVERVLKKTPSATVYQVDASGEIEPIVQGPRQVSDYVATKLIGLSHTAFTATFFTRQKELHLFGDQTPGKRREEVGRLLGLETIRTAQKTIIADRSKAAAEAKAMMAQYEREAEGRNFTAELAAATLDIEERTAQLAIDAAAVGTAEQVTASAETALARAQLRRDEDSALEQQIGQCAQERQALDHRRSRLAADLERLAVREAERARLAPIAARLPSLQAEVATLEMERTRFEQATELDRNMRECDERQRDVNAAVRRLVEQASASQEHAGWLWSTDDTFNPIPGVRRLLAIVDTVDVGAAEQRERRLHDVSRAATSYEQALNTLARFQNAQNGLAEAERQSIADGEPKDRLTEIDRERDKLLHDRTMLHATRTGLESDRDKARVILANLDEQRFGDDCPTCGRPFSQGDASIVANAMRQRVEGLGDQIAATTRDAKAADSALAALELRRKGVFAEIDKLEELRKRLHNSVSVLDSQQQTTVTARAEMDRALTETGLTAPPTAEQIEHAEHGTRRLRALVAARSPLVSTASTFTQLDERQRSAQAARQALGEMRFDPEAFHKTQLSLQEADRAQIAIAQIEQDLARRPELANELAAAVTRVRELDDEATTLAGQRVALAYQAAELPTAQREIQAARDGERSAVARYHRTTTNLRETEMQRETIVKEQQRLDRLAKMSDAKRSEADYLDLMAREFTEFGRFAASRKRPILAEYTSHLVSGITDGKYDRVDFDHDFGIIVYAGDDAESSYAVDTFSGGERDAITLAARIALSQMIGRQGANPPGFLVLDEVFGSLDTDRRAHLLDMLGSISGTFDELRQVFIISHVDDVRTSPVLDELWRIEEMADGSSTVTSLGPGAEIDTV